MLRIDSLRGSGRLINFPWGQPETRSRSNIRPLFSLSASIARRRAKELEYRRIQARHPSRYPAPYALPVLGRCGATRSAAPMSVRGMPRCGQAVWVSPKRRDHRKISGAASLWREHRILASYGTGVAGA